MTIYNLEAPLHPPFEPRVVLRTNINGARVLVTMASPYTLDARAVVWTYGAVESVTEREFPDGTVRTTRRALVASGWSACEMVYSRIYTLSGAAERVANKVACAALKGVKGRELVPEHVSWDERLSVYPIGLDVEVMA